MISTEELMRMADEKDVSWIKVGKWDPYDVADCSDEVAFDSLLYHHKEETEFLIEAIRSLAKQCLFHKAEVAHLEETIKHMKM